MSDDARRDHGERLASVETEIRSMRKMLERITETMERLARGDERMNAIEKDLQRVSDAMKALDSDNDLQAAKIDRLENEAAKLTAFVYSRWWVLVTITTVAATVGGYFLQKFIALL